jgi:O-antigen/teichoic acid export membrane protein
MSDSGDNGGIPLRQPDSLIGRLRGGLAAVARSGRNLWQNLKMPLYRNAIYLMMAQALNGAFGLAFWIVAARLYDADDVGLASTAISAILLLTGLAGLGLDYALIRFMSIVGDDSRRLINTSLTISAVTSAAMATVFLAGLHLWSPALLYFRNEPLRAAGFVVFAAMVTVYVTQDGAFIGLRSAGFSLAKGLMFNFGRIALLVPLAALFGAFGLVSAWGVSAAVALAIGAVIFLPRVSRGYRPVPDMSRSVIDRIIRYSLTNYVSIILWTCPGYILPLMVANLVNIESAAYFYAAWAIANVLFQVPMAVSFSLFAEGSVDEQQLEQNTRRSLKLSLLIVIPISLLIAISASLILMVFKTEYADTSANLLRLLALSAVPMSVNCMYFVVHRVRMRLRNVVALSGSIALAALALSWFLLPRVGIVGAGIAWLSAQTAAALAVLFLLHRSSSGAKPTTES